MIMVEEENQSGIPLKFGGTQVNPGGFGDIRNANEQDNELGRGARVPKDVWSRDPEEIEAMFDRHKASVGDSQDDIKSIAKILYRLVTGTQMEGNLYKL